jgi:hypothetical protein
MGTSALIMAVLLWVLIWVRIAVVMQASLLSCLDTCLNGFKVKESLPLRTALSQAPRVLFL